MSFEETAKNLSLDSNQVVELNGWVSNVALSTKVPSEEIKNFFVNRTSEAITAGLNTQLTMDQFLEFVKSHVMSDTMSILPPPPGVPIELLPFGYYAGRPRTSGNKTEWISQIIGWGKLADTGLSVASIMAYGAEAMLKRNSLNPFNVYNTIVAHNADKRTANLINGSIHKDTIFDGNIVKSANFPHSLQDIYRNILAQYPIVPLGSASANISRLLQTDKRGGTKSKPFPDSTDIKIIQVRIVDWITGRRKDTSEWATYKVLDSTFMPQTNHKNFNVWIDPALARKVGAGIGSYVKLLGTLEHDMNQQFIEMNCCAIIPDKIVPLVETTANLGGNASGLVTNVPAATGKVLNISL